MKKIINSRVKRVLKELIVSKIEMLQARESITGKKDENSPLINQLFEELTTPKESYSIIRGDKIKEDSIYTGKRNVQKISLILKLLPQLKKFFIFNKIGYDALRTAAFFLELKRVPKNTYIFQQGQSSDLFYGIIHGRVSIRSQKKIKHARRRTSYDIISADEEYRIETVEEELNVLTSGSYFGEIGIIEKKERTAAAYTLEDCDLFCLDAKAFEFSFGKYITKAENERKNFLLELIAPFKSIPRSKFNQIYRNFIRAQFVARNDVIYTEGTTANNFYIIYEGQFRLKKKNLSEKGKYFHENFYQSDVAKHHVVLNITKGDFAGLETFLNYDNSSNMMKDGFLTQLVSEADYSNEKVLNIQNSNVEKTKYKNSLIAESEYNVIFSLNPNLLGPDLRNEFYEFLKPIFEKREKFISEIFKNHQVIKEKMKLNYREKLITNISKNNNKKLLEKIDQIGNNDNYLRILKPLKLENLKNQNDFKNLQITLSTINSDRAMKYSISNLNTESKDKSDLTNSNNKLTINASPRSDTQQFDNIFAGNSFKHKLSLLNLPTKSEINRNKRFTLDVNTIDRTLCITERSPSKKPIITLNTLSTIDKKESIIEKVSDNLLTTVCPDNNIRSSLGDNTVISKDIKKRIKMKIISESANRENYLRGSSNDINKYVHKYVAKTINNWNKLNKDNTVEYSSGDFNLPLVSRINTTREKTEG